MTSPYAGLVESEAVGPLPEDTARPQMLVYARCIQRYRSDTTDLAMSHNLQTWEPNWAMGDFLGFCCETMCCNARA